MACAEQVKLIIALVPFHLMKFHMQKPLLISPSGAISAPQILCELFRIRENEKKTPKEI